MNGSENLGQSRSVPDSSPTNSGQENIAEQTSQWYPLFPKRYEGHGEWPHRYATVNGIPLREDVSPHGPGFEWGYSGGGPASLADSILYDFFAGRPRNAPGVIAYPTPTSPWEHYAYEFRHEIIARLPHEEGWILNSDDLSQWIKTQPPYDMEKWQRYLLERADRRLRGFDQILNGILLAEPEVSVNFYYEQFQERVESLAEQKEHRDGRWVEQVENLDDVIFEALRYLRPVQ